MVQISFGSYLFSAHPNFCILRWNHSAYHSSQSDSVTPEVYTVGDQGVASGFVLHPGMNTPASMSVTVAAGGLSVFSGDIALNSARIKCILIDGSTPISAVTEKLLNSCKLCVYRSSWPFARPQSIKGTLFLATRCYSRPPFLLPIKRRVLLGRRKAKRAQRRHD